MTDATRRTAKALTHCARSLLQHAGLDEDKAADVAAILVEGDLLGHDTHGLALLAGYLGELDKGSMGKTGSYATVQARGAAQPGTASACPARGLCCVRWRLRRRAAGTARLRMNQSGLK